MSEAMERSSIPVIQVLAAFLGTAGLVSGKFMSRAYKHEMLLIGLSDERGVTPYAAIVVSHLCLMTAASGGICTYIAGHVFKSARTPKTAGAFTPSPAQRRQISVR
jgi:hypothetical protein